MAEKRASEVRDAPKGEGATIKKRDEPPDGEAIEPFSLPLVKSRHQAVYQMAWFKRAKTTKLKKKTGPEISALRKRGATSYHRLIGCRKTTVTERILFYTEHLKMGEVHDGTLQ